MDKFSPLDYWRALILYGLNQATYKIALGNALLNFAERGSSTVSWSELSLEFLRLYQNRLLIDEPMPQQGNPTRRTEMERIVHHIQLGQSIDDALDEVGERGLSNVIPRFHNLADLYEVKGKFFRFNYGKSLTLTDEMFVVVDADKQSLHHELSARWGLLEGAFSLHVPDYSVSNDIRSIYLQTASRRKELTSNIPFLQGYQGNTCFYCSELIAEGDIHVDHVLPRSVLLHDEVWNLVLAHSLCNSQKSDQLIDTPLLSKLIARNENIVGSNHPWKRKIAEALGMTPSSRSKKTYWHYENVKSALGRTTTWGGSNSYNPVSDPFFKRLITKLNNK